MGSEWLEYKLADLCDSIDYGFTTSAKDEPVGPKFLRITDIVSGHIDWDNVPYCESDQANTKKYLLYDNDIVIARTGASTGKVCLYLLRRKQYLLHILCVCKSLTKHIPGLYRIS